MERGDHLSSLAGRRFLTVFRDPDVTVIVTVVALMVFVFLQVLGSCPEVCAVVIIFIGEFAGYEGRLGGLRGELILLVLYPDDFGLDWWSRVLHWGRIRLVVEMRLIRHRNVLPPVERQMLPGLFVRGVVCSLLEVLLWFAVARVMRSWLGMRLWFSVVGVVHG